MTELERRALMGNKQAQQECTEKGIVLACPCCGKSAHWDFESEMVYHNYGDCISSGKFIPLPQWNARPAPPIGKCGECEHLDLNNRFKDCYACEIFTVDEDFPVFTSESCFCSFFKPKECE